MRNRLITYLILLAVMDLFIPVPLLALGLIWVAVRRPAWFLEKVQSIYAEVRV